MKVLDIDTITQVKDKILDQVYRGAPFSQRPAADSLDLGIHTHAHAHTCAGLVRRLTRVLCPRWPEWRSGQAGHLTLSDDDVTAVVQGRWKRLNTLQHYKVRRDAVSPLRARFPDPPPLWLPRFPTGRPWHSFLAPRAQGESESTKSSRPARVRAVFGCKL